VNGKRLVATALSIALVIGALVVRRSVIDDDDDAGGSSGGRSSSQLVCITELTSVCEELQVADPDFDVTIEDAGVTLDRLAALDDSEPAPLWLTVEPYPAMVDRLRAGARSDELGFETTVLAASQLGIAFRSDGRLDVLLERCQATTVSWRCIGDHVGDSWADLGGDQGGVLRPAFGDVDRSALALGSFAGAVAGYFDDTAISSNRLADTSFVVWLRRLAAGTTSGSQLSGTTALATMTTRESAVTAAATASFEFNSLGASVERFELNYPQPDMWLQVVLATPGGVAAPDDLASDATALLRETAWDETAAAGAPLPSAATMIALLQLWNDAA
jgi:hypothetical protein